MELKKYQKRVLQDLSTYLDHLNAGSSLHEIFHNYWTKQDITRPESYEDSGDGVPFVSLKVPTAGGKTLIGTHAIGEIISRMTPGSPRVVLWFVPWDTLLRQTINNFRDTDHPYRRRLDEMFGAKVEVVDKDELLSGKGLNPTSVSEQVTIAVLSMQSFRAKNKEARKVHQENGAFIGFESQLDATKAPDGTQELSLSHVLKHLSPIVVVDECHRVKSDLSKEFIHNLNARFILGLSATPLSGANVISYVDAFELKQEEMVKLPVLAYNLRDKSEVIHKAVEIREHLEAHAKEEQKVSKRYVRPIVLFQAEPRNREDVVDYVGLKKQLIGAGIPEDQIAIKTAEIDEIKGKDLMSEDSSIRYIITINALKEGWDCSFAYILASLANKSSVTDVTQILGRILRQPHAKRLSLPVLNIGYVLSASNQFQQTVDGIIDGLNAIGFGKEDVKQVNLGDEDADPLAQTFGHQGSQADIDTPIDQLEIQTGSLSFSGIVGEESRSRSDFISEMEKQATKQEQEFSQEANKSQNLGISSELVGRTDIGIIKDAFLSHTSGLSLPQFCFSHTAGIFESEHKAILQKSELLKGFSLASADASVILDFVEEDIVMIDKQEDESSVTHKHLNVESQSQLLSYLLSLPEEKQLETIIGMIVKGLDKKKNEIKTSDLHTYVRRVIDGQEKSVIEQLHQNYHAATRKISDKLDTLQSEYAKKVFLHELEAGNITLESTWTFPEQLIVPTKTTIEKGLYTRESDVSGFERSMLERVASQSNVVFWHRILQRKGFVINGWINHHPDFLIQTQSGKTVLVETKGDQLDGSDSKDKIELGRLWQEKSGDGFKYIMLFQDKEVDGAKTLDEFLSLLSLW